VGEDEGLFVGVLLGVSVGSSVGNADGDLVPVEHATSYKIQPSLLWLHSCPPVGILQIPLFPPIEYVDTPIE